jgi:hypothetical protein
MKPASVSVAQIQVRKYPSMSDGSSDGSDVALPRIEDPKAYLRDETSSLDEPFESSIAGVLEFRSPLSGRTLPQLA